MILKFCKVTFIHTQTINSMLLRAFWYLTFINAFTSHFCCCKKWTVLKWITLVPSTNNVAENWAQRKWEIQCLSTGQIRRKKICQMKHPLVSPFYFYPLFASKYCLPSTLASTWTNFYNNFSKVWFMYLKNMLIQTNYLSIKNSITERLHAWNCLFFPQVSV